MVMFKPINIRQNIVKILKYPKSERLNKTDLARFSFRNPKLVKMTIKKFPNERKNIFEMTIGEQ